jgi:hypothetical protein
VFCFQLFKKNIINNSDSLNKLNELGFILIWEFKI